MLLLYNALLISGIMKSLSNADIVYLFSRYFDTQELGIFNKKVENTESQLVVGTRYILKKYVCTVNGIRKPL